MVGRNVGFSGYTILPGSSSGGSKSVTALIAASARALSGENALSTPSKTS